MKKLTKEQVNQIAGELDAGLSCYINEDTGEIQSIINPDEAFDNEELWEKELEKIEENWENYTVIEKMSSREAFIIMEDFIPKIISKKTREQAINALNRRSPFRNFRDVVEYNENTREQWFDHKKTEYIKHVIYELNDNFEIDEKLLNELEQEDLNNSKEADTLNFDGKEFLLLKNSAEGKVSSETQFYFEQEGDLISAEYEGGNIRYGKIIALQEGEELNMMYQCITKDNTLKAGKATAKIQVEENGKIRLFVNWEWLDEKNVKGTSEYLEL